ncbi:MAG: methyltransferase domain-containing protein [Candidatus Dormibacter sp.]
MDPLKASIVKAWDRGVADYDELVAHGRLSRSEADAWKAALTRLLPPVPATVLEVGAGTGVMSLLLAELGYAVTATDISKGMLDEARRKASDRRLAIAFEIADAEALPFTEGSFDAVFGRHILWTLPHPDRALREWCRVLKPHGRLALVDSLAVPPSLAGNVRGFAANLLLRLRRPTGTGHRYSPQIHDALPLAGNGDPRRYTALIEQAGFELTATEALDRLKALELQAMPLAERWHAQDRKYAFTARRP